MSDVLTELHAHYYKGKKVLVTGGAGFIGSHLVDRLVCYGADVTVLDNLSTGRIDNLGISAAHINFVPGSICSKALCEKTTTGVSHLFHLAAMASVIESCQYPERCQKNNIEGTQTLYQAACKNKIKSIVFSSSTAIYGPRDNACTENDVPNPISPYATSKLTGEELGRTLATQYDIAVANLRYFNVYGPRQTATSEYSGVVAAFTHQLKTNKPITFYGKGEQTRDFIHVDQVVTANLHAGLCHQLRGQAINVASGTSITLKKLLSQLEKELNTTAAAINYEPFRQGDIAYSAADTQRLQRLLNYKPEGLTGKNH